MGSSPSYAGDEEFTTVRPYEKSRVSLPKVGADAPHLLGILDEVGEQTLRTCEHSMLRSPQEWGKVCEEGTHIFLIWIPSSRMMLRCMRIL